MKAISKKTLAVIASIKFLLDVDFVPYDKVDYENLPEPHRKEAMRLWDMRNENWDQLVEDTKRSHE